MRALQQFAVDRPVATSMFFAAVCLVGLISFFELEVNLLPEIEFPRLTVITPYADASPEEIENLITRPLSESVRTAGGVRHILSESLEGVSFISLQFGWDSEVDFAAMEVREKVDLVRGQLPTDAGRSIISRYDPSEEPFMEIAIFAQELARPRELRDFVKKNVKGYLDRVDGVALVSISGGYNREVQIDVDQGKMLAHGLGLPDLARRIRATNQNFPAGSVQAGDKEILVRTVGEYATLEDVGRTVVGGQGVATVRLADIARVRQDYEERTGFARYNGRECVLVGLRRESGKNLVNTAGLATAEVERLRARFGRELDIRVIYDRSQFVRDSISGLIGSLFAGGALAFLALLLILRNLRSPLILVAVIPVSLLGTFIFLYLRGISLNLMSLGGLALGLGMLFDAGNVVLSAIERHAAAGADRRTAALRGAGEVTGSVVSAVLTTVIVFLPVVFLESVLGVVFAEMALTITVGLLVSMVTALTLIPMLAALPFLDGVDLNRFRIMRLAARAEEGMESAYALRLAGALENPRRLLRLVVVLCVLALIAFFFVSREFVPRVDTGEFQIEIRSPRGTTLEATGELVSEIEGEIKKTAAPQHLIVRAGYDPDDIFTRQGGEAGTHRSLLRVIVPAGSARDSVRALRPLVRAGAGTKIAFEPGGDILGEILSPDSKSVALDLSGPDLDVLRDTGQELAERIARTGHVVDVRASLAEKKREYHFLPDRDRTAVYNLSNEYLANYLHTAVDGEVVSGLRVGDEEIDIRLRATREPADARSLSALEALRMRSEDGKTLFVSQAGSVREQQGYTSILRQGPVRVNRITAEIEEGRADRVLAAVEDAAQALELPDGYALRFAGEKENIAESFRELLFALVFAVVLIYMLLAAQFESFRFALLMLAAVPLIGIGVFPALAFTGKSLNISSFTGLILLVGIVVDNGALLYEYIHIFQAEGHGLRSAIEKAGRTVLRPLLMNNGTTVLAMVPVALELGQGSEFQSPMAITVIAGLIASTFLSLLVVPALFYIFLSRAERAHK